MKRAEREALLRQGVSAPETPRDRRNLAGLAEDLRDSPGAGRGLPLRLRNFRPNTDAYLAALGGPRAYMVRLRQIDELTEEHRQALATAWFELASEGHDGATFAHRWNELAAGWNFDEVNDLIARHNRWYPTESRLPMDPKRRDFALVNGKDYRRDALGAAWILAEFPARREDADDSLRQSEARARAS